MAQPERGQSSPGRAGVWGPSHAVSVFVCAEGTFLEEAGASMAGGWRWAWSCFLFRKGQQLSP